MEFLFSILVKLIEIYQWALIIYILMSWFPNARGTAIGKFLERICEPFLEPFRRIIPPIGMIDISPFVAFFVLRFAVVGLTQLFIWIS
ncbi:YggT family protein [Bacillus massilinigeriensis]|uniref:YggT family protein n=1 Tax=Bacillus mediterraneensis TaxID=1805474 RepID=UPI0008F9191D|nr:YggT family protein [Bacillus mediterraneensis]